MYIFRKIFSFYGVWKPTWKCSGNHFVKIFQSHNPPDHGKVQLDQSKSNQIKAKFCLVGAIEASPVNPKSQLRKNTATIVRSTPRSCTWNPSNNPSRPWIHRQPTTMANKTHTWNPSNAHAVHQATINSPLPSSINANHTQNPSTQKSSTHHIHSNPTHQKQLRHNLTSRNSTWKS